MKQKQWIALFGMVSVALILAACDGDSGNNCVETEVDSSSSAEFSSSSGLLSSSSGLSSSLLDVSSSSSIVSSSNVTLQSSSSIAVCTNTYGTNTVTDCRDNQTYKTVVIGTQTWMAENLNYAVDSSWCYENSVDSCAKYGRLYQWAAAMALHAPWGESDVNHQGVCPAGWHIPTDAEWITLQIAVGEDVAGTALKNTSGWYEDGNGTDAYGFSALPGGYRNYYGSFGSVGSSALFWSATEGSIGYAYTRDLYYSSADMGNYDKAYALSVRCIKD